MNLVLAVEPDSSQADSLTFVVRTKLGAQLQLVSSLPAAIVSINQHIPDVVLLGSDLAQDQRTRLVTHLRSLMKDGQVRTLDIPRFQKPAPNTQAIDIEAFAKKVGACLAAAEDARVRSMAAALGRPAAGGWGAVTLESPVPASAAHPELAEDDEEIRAADVILIEAEVEFRLQNELDRLKAETARQRADELARVEAEAAERRAREIARVETEAAKQREADLARIEGEAASKRESAVAEARAAAEAAARESLVAELERVRREAEQHLADEVRRVRGEGDRMLASRLEVAQSEADRDREERIERARAESDAARNAAVEEARRIVEQAAARARMAEDEIERVRSEADAYLKEAMARARAESEAQLQAEVARAQAETEARLEAQLASVIGEAEQARYAQRHAMADADKIRMEAALTARAAAEVALAEETARIRAEANERLGAEIARLRTEAGRASEQSVDDRPLIGQSSEPEQLSVLALVSWIGFDAIRWDYVATAGLVLLIIVAGVLYLPNAVSTVAKTSSTLVGNAGKAAKQAAQDAAAVAPVVTRRALDAAERAMPRPSASKPSPEAAVATLIGADSKAAPETGPGFITVFSRIPMDVYADGTRIGTTEDGQLLLKSGKHRLEFVSTHFHYRGTATVTIRPGRVLPYNVTLPTSFVHVTTTPGSEIWVEGRRVGIAPFEPIPVPIGTREIMVKDGAGGEKRQTIEVTYGVNIDISLFVQPGAVNSGPSIPRLAPLAH